MIFMSPHYHTVIWSLLPLSTRTSSHHANSWSREVKEQKSPSQTVSHTLWRARSVTSLSVRAEAAAAQHSTHAELMEQIDDELLVNRSGITSESETTMSLEEPRALPCWASPSRSCWPWPHPSAAPTAGTTRTSCCRPSTPPGDSWPAWRWMWATPRDPWRSPKPPRSVT